MKQKIILAYSGGLNSTALIPWLKENHDLDVIAVCVDIGQAVDWKMVKKRAMAAGALDCHIVDAKKEFVSDYIWPLLKAGAIYDDKCLPIISAAQSIFVKILVDYARNEKAIAIAHGASCSGNSQVRLRVGIPALEPELEIIAPRWIWKLRNRKDVTRYLARKKISFPPEKKNTYDKDGNLWYSSCKGLDIEDPANEPQYKRILSMTVMPEKSPNKPEYVEIEFEKGIPVALNGKKTEGAALVNQLNKIGGANGIGITDMIENHITGKKSRVVYETPAGSILYHAHQELERNCLDRQTYTFKQQTAYNIGELVYGGFWFSSIRKSLSAVIDGIQETVNGKVKLKLYKGSICSAGITSPNSRVVVCPKPEQENKKGKKPAACISPNGRKKTTSAKPRAAEKK